jgi:hypothetical protein
LKSITRWQQHGGGHTLRQTQTSFLAAICAEFNQECHQQMAPVKGERSDSYMIVWPCICFCSDIRSYFKQYLKVQLHEAVLI